jgi:hypothetical protein
MTSPGDPASFGDAFFHVANLDQMDTTLVSPCGSFTASGNHVPTADAGLNYVIPRGTPFVLTGSGADADAGDALTYTWDEVDKAPSAGNITLGPRFRWRPPTSAPIRSFPALATVLANTSDTLEALPTVDRLLTFRLTVRDNHPGAGAHAWDECVLTVSGAPFAVTSPNGGESLPSDQPFDVTWNVGGGSVAAFVDLFISTDGGASWSTLASHVANDGSQSVSQIVGTTRTHCRVKVAASGNVFYDVSNADFTLIDGVTAVASGAVVERLAIRNVAPNPARGRIAIEYSLPHAERGRLSIVDIQGRIVAVLADGVLPQGVGHANWISRRSGPGIYCVRLESGGSTVERRFATTR